MSGVDARGSTLGFADPEHAGEKADEHDERAAQIGKVDVYVKDKARPDRSDDASKTHKGVAQAHSGSVPGSRTPRDEGEGGWSQEGLGQDEKASRQEDGEVGIGKQEH